LPHHAPTSSCIPPPPPRATLFPYTTLFRSAGKAGLAQDLDAVLAQPRLQAPDLGLGLAEARRDVGHAQPSLGRVLDFLPEAGGRSEEHTSELQSPDHLVCRLLLEKKNQQEN